MTKSGKHSDAQRNLSRRDALRLGGAAISLAAAGRHPAAAQGADPYRIVIAFPPGGTSTASMQPMIEPLQKLLGAPITLDYQPGAGGDLAALHVARAKPDGHTLLFGHAGPLAINPHLTVLIVYDPQKELEPIALVVRFPIVVCAHTKLGITTMDGLIAAGQTRQLVIGSSGNGSIQHLAGEALKRAYGLKTLHLPFAGGGPVQEALVKGALDVLCETGSNVVRHIAEGRLVALAVMSSERLAMLPDVPTFTELGRPELDVAAWFGLMAPAGTPANVQAELSKSVLTALQEDSVRSALLKIGGLPSPLDRTGFRDLIASEYKRWGGVIRDAGIKPIGTDSAIGVPR